MTNQPFTEHSQTEPLHEYDAFISYRTSRLPDGPVGEVLQEVLESYPVPASLKKNVAKPGRFRSRLRICRDTTDLSASGDLSEAIKKRLRVARWLLVICSPETPRSDHCKEEMRYFRELHGSRRILFLLIAGEPHQSLPLLDSQPHGERVLSEADSESPPLAADVRAPDVKGIIAKLRGRGIPKSAQARFKILAPLLACDSPDTLIQRHRARVRRLALQVAAAVLAIGLGAGALIFRQVQREATRSEAEQLLAGVGLAEPVSIAEVDALWQLSSHSKAVRLEFLRQAVRIHPRRFNRRAGMVTKAVMGADPAMAQAVKDEILTPLMRDGSLSVDATTTRALLGLRLPVTDPDFFVMAFQALLSQEEFHDVSILSEEPDWSAEGTPVSRALGRSFWSRLQSLDERAAKAAVASALHQMKSVKDPLELSRWAMMLRALKWVPADALRLISRQIMVELPNLKAGSHNEDVDAVVQPYLDLWQSVPGLLTADDVREFAPLMTIAMKASDTGTGLEEIRQLFIDRIQRTEPDAREAAVPLVLAAMKTGIAVSYLDDVLLGVPDLLTPESRKARVAVLVGLLVDEGGKQPDDDSFLNMSGYDKAKLAARLGRLPGDLSAADVAKAQSYLVSALNTGRDPSSVDGSLEIGYLTAALVSLSRPLPPSIYWQVAAYIVDAMKSVATNNTPVALATIADASAKLPQPSSIASDGREIHAAIIQEIGRIDIGELFFADRLRAWLRALHAMGGKLPAANCEALSSRLLAKMATTRDPYDIDDVIESLIAIEVDGERAAKVVAAILTTYEIDPTQGFNLIHDSGVKDWHPALSAGDYIGALSRMVGLMRNRRANDDMLAFLNVLRGIDSYTVPAATVVALVKKADSMPELEPLRKAQLRSLLEGRPLSSKDIAAPDLVSALRGDLVDGRLRSEIEFPEADRERVVRTVLSAVERCDGVDECYASSALLLSLPFDLKDDEKYTVAEAIVRAFEKSRHESETELAEELLKKIAGGLGNLHSRRIVESAISQTYDFSSMPISLSADDAARFTARVIRSMKGADEWSLGRWYGMLGKLNHALSGEQRHQAALPALEQIVKQAKTPADDDEDPADRRDELKGWLAALEKIPGGPSAEDQKRALDLTFAVLASSGDVVGHYPREPTEVIGLLQGADEPTLLELLKWPTMEAGADRALLTLLEKRSKASFRNDLWSAARWAESAGLDVTSPPLRPQFAGGRHMSP